jgi:hypothetical protein
MFCVSAGRERQEAVALNVLGSIGIARPEHQNKGLVARRKQREYRAGRDRRQKSCCTTLETLVPGVVALPAEALAPRGGVAAASPAAFNRSTISGETGMPCAVPVHRR